MNNVLIHIGYHKTGTTWLQQEVFSKTSSVFEPLSLNEKDGHSSLARDFIWGNDGYLLNPFDLNENSIYSHLKEIKTKKGNSDKIYVMTDERLSGSPHSSGFNSSVISKRIKNIFPKGKILIVIREQNSWLLSNYFQYLTAGGTHSLKKYLNTKYDGKRPGFSPNHVFYHYLIQDYQNKFGKENVLVLPYELFRSEKSIFLEKISEFINKKIVIDNKAFENVRNKNSNYYLNYKLRFLNRFVRSTSVNNNSPFSNKFSRIIALSIKRGTALLFPQKLDDLYRNKLKGIIEEWANGRYIESNKITDKLIDGNLEKYNYW